MISFRRRYSTQICRLSLVECVPNDHNALKPAFRILMKAIADIAPDELFETNPILRFDYATESRTDYNDTFSRVGN